MKTIFLKRFLAMTASAALFIGMMACCGSSGGSSSPDAGTADGSSELAAEQVLNLTMGSNIFTMDVNNAKWTDEIAISTQVHEGLFRVLTDDAGRDVIVEAGCVSYDVSDDGIVYTFHLRENAWSDGVSVTAQQYVDSFLRFLDPDNGFDATDVLPIKNAQAIFDGESVASALGAVALDELTLEVTLEAPNSAFIYGMSTHGYPVRMDLINAATSEYGTSLSGMAFNGPFVVTNWINENSITLKKNSNYWDAENVILETVNLNCVLETSTQATLFQAKQLDVVSYNDDNGADWEAQAASGQIRYIDQTGSYCYYLAFPFATGGTSGMMSNEKIRLALSLAVDREELVSLIYGRYEAAYTYVPPIVTLAGEYTYNTSGEGIVKDQQTQYDTDEKLQQLFKEGLEELGLSTDLGSVTLNFTAMANTTANQARAEYLGQTWESRLGIKIDVNIANSYSDYLDDEKFDVTICGWEGGSSPYLYMFIVNVPYSLKFITGSYHNDRVSGLLDTVTSLLTVEEQAAAYHEAENTMLGEVGIAPLYFNDIKYFTQTYVEGLYFTAFGPYFDFSRAYITAH